MKFGEKVKILRERKRLSQTELGNACDLSLRTIRNYEIGGMYPKQREVYAKLASALGCDINFLLTENEDSVVLDQQTYETYGAEAAESLVQKASEFFYDESVSDKTKDTAMRNLLDVYWSAKEQTQEIHAPPQKQKIQT